MGLREGYQWRLSDNFTEGVVKLVKSEYVAPDTEMVGVGGRRINPSPWQ